MKQGAQRQVWPSPSESLHGRDGLVALTAVRLALGLAVVRRGENPSESEHQTASRRSCT